MVTITLRCPFCNSEALIKSGLTPNGKQRYRCRDWGRPHQAEAAPNGYTPKQREVILRAYQERSCRRGLSRPLGVWRITVSRWLKNSPEFGAVGHNAAAGRTRRGARTR